MAAVAFEENEILFGADGTEGIVAVEPAGDRFMRLFIRNAGKLTFRDDVFRPFLLLEDVSLLDGFKKPVEAHTLTSKNEFRFLVLFETWNDCKKAVNYLRSRTGKTPSAPEAPYLFLSDPVHQYLLFSGKTLFKKLSFKDLHRLALDIETATSPGYTFSNPLREEDRILSIALLDNRGRQEVLFGSDLTEKEMLQVLSEYIREIDPDVLEGHNLFNFDLNYIVTRARMHGIQLRWGRDGSQPYLRRSRFTVAERIIDYTRMDIYGRHILDTMFLLQYYDVTARELNSYGLKQAAQHFGLATADRVYLEASEMAWHFEHEPELFKQYNLDDVRETLALSELLAHPFFLQTRIFPYSYQNVLIRGNATKINSLFLREYIRQRTSIPRPKSGAPFAGGYTDVFHTGILKPVVSCDVTSLYPSILLTYKLQPSGDSLGIFLPLLDDLRSFRLAAKERAHRSREAHDREYHEALQQTFKVLINSFYGYLGTRMHHFADPEVAGEVTRRGRKIIRQMISWLRQHGAEPIEIDTDGIYFLPPEDITSREEAAALVQRLSDDLPTGIEVELAGIYRAMFSYKKKNYALLTEQGEIIIKGSALRSRGMERYLREFLMGMIRLLLEEKGEDILTLLQDFQQRIAKHELPIEWLAKTETLRETPESYKQKVLARKRNPAAAYELALAARRDYRAGDQISYYVTGTAKKIRMYDNCKLVADYDPDNPDENIAYYQEKLRELARKFADFIPTGVLQ
ncbi:MAG: DNA polymerase II [Deltaproteobacteria bacterium]|nr:DNA polymerase II [Deltaproteobacteria bacterium]MBW2071934.1 DNA polymerase II [Deltaproteobacteria bacterium]